MANLFTRLGNSILRTFQSDNNNQYNPFNNAFLGWYGGNYAPYDSSMESYINEGYNINPMVFSMINAMSQKSANVPMYVKEVENESAATKLNQLFNATKGDLSVQQQVKFSRLVTKAFSKEDRPFPMERPNATQTWAEFIALYKTFLKCTGNAYIYSLSPDEGMNAGTPLAVYLLPSHLVQIVIKENVRMLGIEDPVKEYILTYGKSFICFKNEDVIHIKYSNPNYGENGEHLYGMSPLEAALHNIQSSNSALDLNIKTLKSGGAFGLIHAKNTPLTADQAQSIKDRLLEMDSSPDQLSKIAGVSAEIGFTRLSLTSGELRPFDYLKFDEEQISKVLLWAMDDGNRGDFGGTIKEVRRLRVVDNIKPDLDLLADALNDEWLPLFKGYENSKIVFDVMELPEMQQDVKEMTEWLNNALDRGVINRNEYRNAIHYLEIDNEDMMIHTVQNDIISLNEAITNDLTIE